MQKRIEVFVSSAMAELEYDREVVQETLASMNVDPVLFEIFPAMSQSPSHSFLDAVRECNVFLMLLWKSLRPAVLEEYAEAQRWNKPTLILVKSLVENEEREPELKAFLSGLSSGSPRQIVRRTTYTNYRSVTQLRQAVRDSVRAEIAKFYEDPTYTISKEEMYELGTSIIRDAQKRLYLYQRTPSLVLGARDYLTDDKAKRRHEKQLVDALQAWIEERRDADDAEFLCLFSQEATRSEIAEKRLADDQHYIEGLKQRVKDLKDLEETSGRRFRIAFADAPISGPLMVGDNRFAIWLLGGNDAFSISQEHDKICHILARMLKAHCQDSIGAAEMLARLGV